MAERFNRAQGSGRAPGVSATSNPARWKWVFLAAIVVALSLAFYGISANQSGNKVANPPAVTAAPAPAAGVPAPAPQTTTGQAAPSAAPSATGGGEGASPQQR